MDSDQPGMPVFHRRQTVEDTLNGFFRARISASTRYGEGYRALWENIALGTRGGKRFRPYLVMTAFESLGGSDVAAAANLAAAYELLHAALVEHDDVIDRDFIRRGRTNVSGRYRDIAHTAGLQLPTAEHRGLSAGVIAGDLTLAGAHRLLEGAVAGIDPKRAAELREVFDDAIEASAAGELADVDFSVSGVMPTVEEILAMSRMKTAVYSFEAPLRSGALLAGAEPERARALAEVGRHLGIAYQLIDDLLGVFGDRSLTGKSVDGDLREGKRTVLIAHAAGSELWPEILETLGSSEATPAQIDHLRGLVEATGAREFALNLARDAANRGWEALHDPLIPERTRTELTPLIRGVLERTR